MDKIRICIDAGHYGKYNRSPVVPSYYESDMVWKLHLMQKEILEGYGFEVVTTRVDQGTDRKLYERGYAAKGCTLFISDHSNACGSEGVDYPVVYRAYDNAGDSDRLALELARTIASVMGTSKSGRTATRRGSTGGEYYGVLRGARAAGLTDYYIVEHSFHTNTAATRWLLDDGNLRRLAEAECQVIAKHYGMDGGLPGNISDMTKITGKAETTAEQMAVYIKGKNASVAQSVLDMIPLYLSEGEGENIRGDIAFAQSCLETGNFAFGGSAVELAQNNFCGMGVTAKGEKGDSFGTPQLGIRAQIQHLKAYANTSKLKKDCVDPRFSLVSRGCAPYVEYLGIQENPKGKGWAAGAGYGDKILKILHAIKGTSSGQENGDTKDNSLKNDGRISYLITTTCDVLNVRSGPGTNYPVVSQISEPAGKKNRYTIAEERSGWGRLKSGAGWISLAYTKKEEETERPATFIPYLITTTCDVLNIRSGPGINYPVASRISEPAGKKNRYTIVEEQSGWGKLKSGAGWIKLSYTVKAS
ncbi:MAG: N-acetylmuramoyl-L-alanine amidase [bacterium]|nr:N-acetylmuramoyl-L-alanine amidase [bacterium]MCM1376113.1 N-acetylmuramoyl-L-alanine amidase [Muribaculum sp.]